MPVPPSDTHEPLTTVGLTALVRDGVFSQALGVLTGGALLTGCALALGASPAFIGVLSAVPFLAQIAHLPAILLIERLRCRKRICVAVTLLARLLLLPLLVVPAIANPDVALGVLLACLALVAPLGAVGGCAWMSWTRDLVPERRRGEIFARRQLRATLSGMIAGLLGAAMVDGGAALWPAWPLGGYLGVFALAIAAAMASTWYLTRMPDLPMAPRPAVGVRALFARPFAD